MLILFSGVPKRYMRRKALGIIVAVALVSSNLVAKPEDSLTIV